MSRNKHYIKAILEIKLGALYAKIKNIEAYRKTNRGMTTKPI